MPTPRELLGRRNPEIWLVTAAGEESTANSEVGLCGMIATAVTSVSIVPDEPRIILGVSKQHATWRAIRATRRFALHLLDEANIELVWRFGLQSSRNTNKLAGLPNQRISAADGSSGYVVIPECLAWLGCRVETDWDIGDRTIFLAEVTGGAELRSSDSPLCMRRLAEIGDPRKLQELREQTAQQAEADRTAIHAWRKLPENSGR